MRVGIDVSQSVYGTGVGDYTKNLVDSLTSIDKSDTFVLFGGSLRRRDEFPKLFPKAKNIELKTSILSPTLADIFWNKLHTLPVENFIGNVDVFHSSDWAQPPTSAYNVTTIHDLAPLKYPQYTPQSIVEVHKSRLRWVAKEVDKIIAVSQSTKEDAIELLKINPEKIIVIPEAGDERIKKVNQEKINRVLNRYGISKEYLIVIGTNPRKNLPRILESYKKLSNKNLELVVVGKKPENTEGGVIYTGFANFNDLSALYSGASALVYASLYEGFGQPILEGFKIGIPVVTSNVSSMPEVAGDCAILVNPTKVDEIAQGIKDALKNRNKLIKKGIERAKEFSWEYTAKLTLRVYKEGAL